MNKREKRREILRKRKSFTPTIVVSFALWTLIVFLLLFVDPVTPGIIYVFFILLFFAIFLPSALLLAKARRGLLLTLVIIIFLVLRYFQIGNVINLILIASAFGLLEYYLTTR